MQKQATAEQMVTQQQSLVLVRNLIRTAVSSICYIRHLFPESNFTDRILSGLNIKTLLPNSPETKLVIDWLEQGVFDAVEKKFLRMLVFGMYLDPTKESTLIECYSFRLSYDGNDYNLDISRQVFVISFDSKISKGLKENTRRSFFTKDGIKQATISMIRTLISLAQTLSPIPKTRYLVMKLFYYDHITPLDYEV
jgi:hypothetical protein